MTTDAYAPSAVEERIRDLCRQFRLPTLAAPLQRCRTR